MHLEDFLAAAKAELVSGLCSTADVKGRECWLWLPKKPMGTHPGPCLVAHLIDIQPLLTDGLLVQADRRIFRAALVERNREIEHHRAEEQIGREDVGVVLLLDAALKGERRP